MRWMEWCGCGGRRSSQVLNAARCGTAALPARILAAGRTPAHMLVAHLHSALLFCSSTAGLLHNITRQTTVQLCRSSHKQEASICNHGSTASSGRCLLHLRPSSATGGSSCLLVAGSCWIHCWQPLPKLGGCISCHSRLPHSGAVPKLSSCSLLAGAGQIHTAGLGAVGQVGALRAQQLCSRMKNRAIE